MKKRIPVLLLLILCALLCAVACSSTDNPPPTESDSTQGSTDPNGQGTEVGSNVENPNPSYIINSFYDLNKNSNTQLSHEKDDGQAVLELDYRSYVRLERKDLKTSTVYYPRIKQMADGRYIMFYQEGEHGNTVLYITSDDLKVWSAPEKLFVEDEDAGVYYATCDAVVLDNGEILAVCSYRTGSTYDVNPQLNGVVMKKSSDNAKTWSEQKIIYVGTTWEPYPMQLKSGEVQVYFTNTSCYYRTEVADASTGTAMVRSYDRGNTWTGDLSKPYSGQIVSQTPTRVSGGMQLYSDQMPVGIEMLGSGKLMLALETRMDKKGTFRISLSYSDDNWKTPLAADQTGPSEKWSKAWTGAAPYLRQFISGEIICAYTRQSNLAYRVLTADGKSCYAEVDNMPFKGISGSYWGGLELIGSHTMVGFGETFNKVTMTRTENTVDYGKLNLNHTINAKNMTPAIDGDAKDWKDNDEAFFIGSISQAQASIRSAADSENLYFLVERLDDYLTSSEDKVNLYFAMPKVSGYYKLVVGPSGVEQFQYNSGNGFKDCSVKPECAVIINGTLDYNDDVDMGYSAEIKIPFSEFGGASDEVLLFPTLSNKDAGKSFERNTLSGSDLTDKSTWLKIKY